MRKNYVTNFRDFVNPSLEVSETENNVQGVASTALCERSDHTSGACVAIVSYAQTKLACLSRDEKGQGTTEYAILVGVLVVIAILAITVFRGKIQELWNNISDGINSL